MDDTIYRQAAIELIKNYCENGCDIAEDNWCPSCQREQFIKLLKSLQPAQPEIIHCKDCIYYDPEHIEKDGVRYEYSEMPKDAFDALGTGLVTSKYGVNVGGRCCRDSFGYLEDKRVFVPKHNYCGRAERKEG